MSDLVPIFRFGTVETGLKGLSSGYETNPTPFSRLLRAACYEIPTPHAQDGFSEGVQQHEKCVLLDEHLRRAARISGVEGKSFLAPEGALWGTRVPAEALRVGHSQALVPKVVLERHDPQFVGFLAAAGIDLAPWVQKNNP